MSREGGVQLVFPDAVFECLGCVVLQRAGAAAGVDAGAGDWVLVPALGWCILYTCKCGMLYLIPPSAIQIPRLKKPGKAGIRAIHPRRLILTEQILPVGRSSLEPFRIACPIHSARNLRNRKVIIRILQRARDTAGHGPEAHGVKVLDGDIVPRLPASQPAAAFGGPVEGLLVGVLLHGCVAGFPVDAVGYVLDVCVCENDVGVGAALGVAWYGFMISMQASMHGSVVLYGPLHSDMRQSGSQPRCRWVSISELIIRATDFGSKMVRKGSWDRKESHKLAWSESLGVRSFRRAIPVERVKIWLGAIPKRILRRVVLRIDHGAIDAAVEIGQERGVDSLSGYSDGTELLRP